MTITRLAPELLQQCFGHLHHADLKRASLVCRSWLAPCRDLYWGSSGVSISDESAQLLAPVLAEGTTIPHKIRSIRIDEEDEFESRQTEETAAWQKNLLSIMHHFSTVTSLTVSWLDLSQFPEEQRAQVLQPGQARTSLIVQWLKVKHAQEATSFILDQPDIKLLGIGTITLAQNDKDKDEKDDDVRESSDGERKENGKDSAAIAAAPSPEPEPVIRLNKLRHLFLFSQPEGIAWSHIVPSLTKGALAKLESLVADCYDGEALVKLIDTVAPALRSIAVSLKSPGININLSEVQSLKHLSLDLSLYPKKEHILTDNIAIVSSTPPSLEHVFFNIGPSMIEPDKQLDSAPSQWAALDAALVAMPRLRRVTVIIVLDSCMSMFVSMGGAGSFIDKWKDSALSYVKTRLPGCDKKGFLEAKNVFSSWISDAFAGYPVPM